MKMEVKIWTVKEGKIKEIKIEEFDNKLFVAKETEEKSIFINPKSSTKTDIIDKGIPVDCIHHTRIYKNILDEIKQYYNFGNTSVNGIQKIIKKYYPKYVPQSLKTTASLYDGYIKGKYQFKNKDSNNQKQSLEMGPKIGHVGKVPIYKYIYKELKNAKENHTKILKRYFPKAKPKTISTKKWAYNRYIREQGGSVNYKSFRKKYTRKKAKPDPDCIFYNKTYKTWIRNNEINKVKRAINAYGLGYVPTSKAIAKRENMKLRRVNAVLGYLINKGEVRKVYIPKQKTFKYEII